MVVVLPAPFGPKNPNISPFLTLKEILSTAVKPLNFFVKFFVFIISKIFSPAILFNNDFVNKIIQILGFILIY